MELNLTVNSNVKVITSGNIPNNTIVSAGQMGFGRITADGSKYHLYANQDGTVIDLLKEGIKTIIVTTTGQGEDVIMSQKAVTDIYNALATRMTTAESTIATLVTDLDTVELNLTNLTANVLQKDNTTAYTPTGDYNPATYKFVKDEIANIGNIFSLKGRVDTFAQLPSTGNKAGDVWLVGLSTAEELDEYVWTTENKWEAFGKTTLIDLSDYYTKAEITSLFANYYTKTEINNLLSGKANSTHTHLLSNILYEAIALKATIADNDNLVLFDSAASNGTRRTLWSNIKSTLKAYFDTIYATATHTHTTATISAAGFMSATDKTKVDKIKTDGTGDKVLTDDGEYSTISVTFNVPQI